VVQEHQIKVMQVELVVSLLLEEEVVLERSVQILQDRQEVEMVEMELYQQLQVLL
tara:strand:+ start:121 stop:285 length:165 start_codon:yes stop_codon:yes gene_type:complete